MRRATILHDLIRFETPDQPLVDELRSFGWDWDGPPLAIIRGEDILRQLERCLAGDISSSDLQRWAENLEVREDVAFDPEQESILDEVFFQIATPEINRELTPEVCLELRNQLDKILPNKAVDSTATRVTPPASSLRSGQESRHGQP